MVRVDDAEPPAGGVTGFGLNEQVGASCEAGDTEHESIILPVKLFIDLILMVAVTVPPAATIVDESGVLIMKTAKPLLVT